MRVVSFGRRMHNIAEIFRFRLTYVNNLVRYRSLASNGWRYYRRYGPKGGRQRSC